MQEKKVKQPTLNQLQNQIAWLKNLKELPFGETVEQRKEFARLTSVVGLGRGESACMVYCRYNKDIIGSSNLKDITSYCDEHEIVYLPVVDFDRYICNKMDCKNCNF